METFDAEVLAETLKRMDAHVKDRKPFFLWFNSTAIHIWSRPNPKYVQWAVNEGRAEADVVRARMIEHDEQVGALLKKLEDLGVADNTIVVYTTDNGNELMFWPDGGRAQDGAVDGTAPWRYSARQVLPFRDERNEACPVRNGKASSNEVSGVWQCVAGDDGRRGVGRCMPGRPGHTASTVARLAVPDAAFSLLALTAGTACLRQSGHGTRPSQITP